MVSSINASEPLPAEQANAPKPVKGNVLTLTTHPRPGRTVAFDKCYLTVDGEKMTGTTERNGSSDKGTIEFVKSKN